jgi:hypothetical protein
MELNLTVTVHAGVTITGGMWRGKRTPVKNLWPW